ILLHHSPSIPTILPQHPKYTLFPYTTLFRSHEEINAIGPMFHECRDSGDASVLVVDIPLAHGSNNIPSKAVVRPIRLGVQRRMGDRKSTRLNSSHVKISYAVFCLKKKK